MIKNTVINKTAGTNFEKSITMNTCRYTVVHFVIMVLSCNTFVPSVSVERKAILFILEFAWVLQRCQVHKLKLPPAPNKWLPPSPPPRVSKTSVITPEFVNWIFMVIIFLLTFSFFPEILVTMNWEPWMLHNFQDLQIFKSC